MDSHLRLLNEATVSAQREGYEAGFEAGRKSGEADLRKRLKVDLDWDLPRRMVDRLYFEDLPEEWYVEATEEAVVAEAASWRRVRETLAWQRLERAIIMDARRRTMDIVKSNADPAKHRDLIAFAEMLLQLPEAAIQQADMIRSATQPVAD